MDERPNVHSEPLQKREEPGTKDINDLYSKLGDPGRFSIMVFAMLAVVMMSISSNMVVGVFFAYTPRHTCYIQPDWSHDAAFSNVTGESIYSAPYLLNGGSSVNVTSMRVSSDTDSRWNVTRTACHIIQDNRTLHCGRGQWRYEIQGGEASTVSDFDLVCERTYLRYLANTLYYAGIMIGSFFCGYVSDAIGRRPVVIATALTTLGLGVAIAFTELFVVFAVLRLLVGIAVQGLYTSTYVLVIEQFPCQHRGRAGATLDIFWGVGIVYLSGAAWVMQDWRFIQVAIVAPLAVATLYLCFIPESLRWLLAKGKTRDASHAIKKVALFNNLTNPTVEDPSLLCEYQVPKEDLHQASYLQLVTVPELRKRAACMGFICFATNIGYFGMIYNTSQLAGSRYLNFFLGAILELIALVLVSFVLVRFGRKRPTMAILVIGSLCCLVVGVLPRDRDGTVNGAADLVVIIFSVLGRAVMCMMFAASNLYRSELFPTVIRSMSVGICAFMGRVGAVVTPQIFALADATFKQMPPLVFCGITMTAAVLTCFLPEPSDQRLPDTVLDVQEVNGQFVTSYTQEVNGQGYKSHPKQGQNGLVHDVKSSPLMFENNNNNTNV